MKKRATMPAVAPDPIAPLTRILERIAASAPLPELLTEVANATLPLMAAKACLIRYRENGEERIIGVQAAKSKPLKSSDLKTALFVPFSAGAQLAGSLEVAGGKGRKPFSFGDLELLTAFARLASLSVTQAEMGRALEGKVRELELRNRELSEARNRLVNAEKMGLVGQMAAGVSHEIRNIITPIRLIVEDPPSPDSCDPAVVAEEYKIIAEQVTKAVELSNGFLSFSRQGDSILKPLSLNDTVRKALRLIEHKFRKGAIRLETALAENLPLVPAIAARLEQAVVNLVNNAEEAMKERGDLIRVETALENGRVRLTVRDNGSGIKPDDLKRMGEPFFTTKEPGKGTGLGVAVVSQIAAQHNGELCYESEWGKGTSASFIFQPA